MGDDNHNSIAFSPTTEYVAHVKNSHTRPQSFRNGEIHDWYRIVLGYSDHLVASLIKEFGLKAGDCVLDPFSGSGTTAVECQKLGIDSWAIDANPSSCFATRVKTRWNIDPDRLVSCGKQLVKRAILARRNVVSLRKDATYGYLSSSGMLDRKWITSANLYDVLAIKCSIRRSRMAAPYSDLLLLALTHVLLNTASNIRFGPELYCLKTTRRANVIQAFNERVAKMADDLRIARGCPPGRTVTALGDARFLKQLDGRIPRDGFDAVICSPPYPTEHDYTRNSRLELALLEYVVDRASLRSIKKGMIRSHTKGIYTTDDDKRTLGENTRINRLVARIDRRAENKTYGFARLYGRVAKEYFGGMKTHFAAVLPVLKAGARCAYVVGDQCSYFRIRIPTAEILAELAKEVGFEVDKIRVWRKRWATTTQKYLPEHILILRKPMLYV
jgi:hypothetical protein